MKQYFLLLILIGLGAWAYFHFYRADAEQAPPPHEPHLAREGTFFVLQYVSVPSNHGIIGFEPGREVHFVRVDHEKGLMVVSDGTYDVEMKPSQLTNDIDIAGLARKGDEDSQRQIKAYIEHQRALHEAKEKAAAIKTAQDLDRANGLLKPGATPVH
jgi:hypothetical protein